MNKKHFLAWLLTVIMIVTLLPTAVFAGTDTDPDDSEAAVETVAAVPETEAAAEEINAANAAENIIAVEPQVYTAEDGRIVYTGDKVGFFKEDGVSEFGMLSLQDGSRWVVSGDQVRIYDIPSNNTVYDGIHWGFITDENLTKDVVCLPSGCWDISVSTDNCGYGIPVAPVKTEARGGGTTGSQYYLCIPALDKIPVSADYSAVDAALAQVPSDLSAYTDESAAAVISAVEPTTAEDFRFYSTAEQAAVTAAAAAIEDAVAGLVANAAGPSVTLEDGAYLLPELKSGPGEMFNHFVESSKILVVSGDTATIRFITDGTTASIQKYSRIALGKASELVTSPYQPDSDLPEGTVIFDGILQPADESGTDKYLFKVTLPKADVEALLANDTEDDIYITIWNNKGASSNGYVPGWYKSSSDFYLSLGTLGAAAEMPADPTAVAVALSSQDNKSGEALTDVTYTVTDPDGAEVTPADGAYTLDIGKTYTITAEALGYRTATENYTAKEGEYAHTVGLWPVNNYFWLQVCLAEHQYAESTPAGTGRGEVVTIQKEGEEPVVAEPDGSHYVFNYLEPGATYTVKVVWEGHDVIVDEEWNVEKHGYYFITDGTTEFTQTLTMPALGEGEFFTNIIARFIEHQEETAELDYTAVDDALAKVPANLRLFTNETADPVRAAVRAVDRDAQSQEAVDAMAEAIETALKGLIPKDGRYEVSIAKESGTPYYLYEGLGDSDRANGKAVLVVENGVMSAEVVLKNTSYGQVALGTKEEVMEAATAAGDVPEGTIDLEIHTDKITVNGKEYAYTTGTIPVPALQTRLNYAYHSSNTSRYTYNTGWYDHIVTFTAASLVPLGEQQIEDETIPLTVINEERMFKVVNAYIEITDGQAELVFAMNSTGYLYVYPGTFDEAMANGSDKSNWVAGEYATVNVEYEMISGETTSEGEKSKLQFRVPADLSQGNIIQVPITAISDSKMKAAERANPENPDYSAAFTGRQALVDLSMGTAVVGNYRTEFDVTVTSSIESFPVETAGSVYQVGTPLANEHTCQMTITMSDDSYDKAFIGTAEAAESAAEDQLIAIGEDRSFVLPFKNSFDGGYTQITGGVAMAAFHSAEQDCWIERTFTLDTDAKTITITGEELVAPTLEDGTYSVSKITTDVTTEASGMIMVTDAIVVIKDGEASAVVTMKGTGADRLYVSETADADTIIAEAIAEEQKEVNGEFGNLIGGLKREGDAAYSFWPVPITLGQPTVYAARSARHFAQQDIAPDKYYYVHDFQIDAKDLTFVSDSTELPVTAEEEAQRYLNQYFMDGKIVTPATAASVTGKNANVTIPYYDAAGNKISSVIFKMAEAGKFRSGWFVDSSILNSTYFSSSNLKKIRYPEGSNGTVTFNPKAAYRDEGMTFTATLKLFPADANYDQYDAEGVYYDVPALAEQTFTITVSPLPEDRHVTINVIDAVSRETIDGAAVTVTKDEDGSAVEAGEDGTYTMSVPGTYTVRASAEGYLVPGTEDTEYVQAAYAPKKDGETLTVTLIKAEESKNTITFSLKDQMDEEVVNPVLTVYRWDDKETIIPAEEDGSYRLYYGVRYGYTVTAEGYEEKTGTILVSGDAAEEVLVNKYLSEQKFTFRVYDSKTNETLEDVTLVVKYGPSDADESIYVEALPDADGVYTIPIDNRVIAYGSKEGYEDGSLNVWSLGFEPLKDCSFGLDKYVFEITKQPVNTNKPVGEVISYTVKAKNAVSYQWYYTKDGTHWYKSSAEGADTATVKMTVKSNTIDNQYHCVLIDKYGDKLTSDTVKNEMTGTPLTITGISASDLADDKTETITVTAENASAYQWYYSKDGTKWYKSTLEAVDAEGSSAVTITVSAGNMNNMYKCRVTGTDGTTKDSEAVSLNGIPVVLSVTADAEKAIGETATISVTAENAYTYQWYYSKDGGENWYKSSTAGAATDTLTLKVKAANDGMMYRCKVTAKCGLAVTSEAVSVTVK